MAETTVSQAEKRRTGFGFRCGRKAFGTERSIWHFS